MSTVFRIQVLINHLAGRQLAPNPIAQGFIPPDRLSRHQREEYERNGFLVIPKLIPEDVLERCRIHFVDICEGRADKGSMTLMKEMNMMDSEAKGEYLYLKIQDIFHDEVFSEYAEYPDLLDYVEGFIGPNIMGMHSMLVNKPPGTSIHPPHQDLHYFPFRPEGLIVASWTAMEKINKKNGCLYVVPGSHKGGLHPHSYPDDKMNKAFHGIQNHLEVAPEEARVYFTMEAGDTVFFHPLLVHGSGLNTSDNFRKAISCHYASSQCYYIETKGTTQEKIAAEMEAMFLRKGVAANFKDIWYLRGKCVRGARIGI